MGICPRPSACDQSILTAINMESEPDTRFSPHCWHFMRRANFASSHSPRAGPIPPAGSPLGGSNRRIWSKRDGQAPWHRQASAVADPV